MRAHVHAHTHAHAHAHTHTRTQGWLYEQRKSKYDEEMKYEVSENTHCLLTAVEGSRARPCPDPLPRLALM